MKPVSHLQILLYLLKKFDASLTARVKEKHDAGENFTFTLPKDTAFDGKHFGRPEEIIQVNEAIEFVLEPGDVYFEAVSGTLKLVEVAA